MKNRIVSGERLVVAWTSQPNQPVRIAAEEDRASPAIRVPAEAPSHLIAGLYLLLRAFDYAADAGGDTWDFAVEISDLRTAGMTASDLRWLVSKGYVQHGQETSVYGVPHRSFHCGEGLTFLPASAFVLTSRGAAEVRSLLGLPSPAIMSTWCPERAGGDGVGFPVAAEGADLPSPVHGRGAGGEGVGFSVAAEHSLHRLPPTSLHLPPSALPFPPSVKPAWEARSRELRVGEFLVKKFRVPAGNQELVLSVFEEEGWPSYIDDPLPMKSEIVPKRRLHNVISRLNGRQMAPILRFHGNGNGEGIGWQVLPPPTDPLARTR